MIEVNEPLAFINSPRSRIFTIVSRLLPIIYVQKVKSMAKYILEDITVKKKAMDNTRRIDRKLKKIVTTAFDHEKFLGRCVPDTRPQQA